MLEEFRKIGKFLYAEGLVDAFGGDLSIRQGNNILITKKGATLADLQANDIIEVGLAPGGADAQASPELPSHRAVYASSKAQAIIHAYPANAIAISLTDNKIVPQDGVGLALYRSAPIVRIRDTTTPVETVRLLPSFLNNSNVVAVIKGHSSFAVGQSLKEAYKYTSTLENSCKIIVAVRSSGGVKPERKEHHRKDRKTAMPPGLGVMDRSRLRSRNR